MVHVRVREDKAPNVSGTHFSQVVERVGRMLTHPVVASGGHNRAFRNIFKEVVLLALDVSGGNVEYRNSTGDVLYDDAVALVDVEEMDFRHPFLTSLFSVFCEGFVVRCYGQNRTDKADAIGSRCECDCQPLDCECTQVPRSDRPRCVAYHRSASKDEPDYVRSSASGCRTALAGVQAAA